jgi:kumamolisin
MPDNGERVLLKGSERPHSADLEDCGRADPGKTAEVTVYLRSKPPGAEAERLTSALTATPLSERQYLTREQLAELRGASPEDVSRVETFANRYGLEVVSIDAGARAITLRGKLVDLETAFGVKLRNFRDGAAEFRDYTGSISLPADVAPAVKAVLGLSTRPAAQTRNLYSKLH